MVFTVYIEYSNCANKLITFGIVWTNKGHVGWMLSTNLFKTSSRDFPGGTVNKNLPADAGDLG